MKTNICTVSIITVNLNNAQGLQKTITSVQSQTFKDFEYIIIDGGSSDNSLKIIKENAQIINIWVSEKDNGVYDAMNKGIARAKGRYLIMLNSGDYFFNETTLQHAGLQNHNEDLIYGNCTWVNSNKEKPSNFPVRLTDVFLKKESICHQAVFIKRDLHNKAGLYNEGYKIASDWEFFLKAVVLNKATQFFLPIIIAVCDANGLSCKPENWKTVISERNDILIRLFNESFKDPMQHRNQEKFLKKIKSVINRQLRSLRLTQFND